jgi:SAM-dependent methyltransferase
VKLDTACRICDGPTDALLTARDRNRELGEGAFSYRRCRVCATVQLVDIPADLERWYAGDYHGTPTADELRGRVDFELHKIELLAAHVAPGSLVEIGPSFGAFAYGAREAGFDVTAIEMDAACCAYLEETVGVRAIHSSAPEQVLPALPPSRVVAMWHVFEHLAHPLRVLKAAAANLEPGGVLAIAVPNPQSLGFRLLRSRWAHLDAPRHLTLLPLATLLECARALGLAPIATTLTDPFARHCNRFAWEYALRRRPAGGPSPFAVVGASVVLERLLAPVERSGLRGSAYTVLLQRQGARGG